MAPVRSTRNKRRRRFSKKPTTQEQAKKSKPVEVFDWGQLVFAKIRGYPAWPARIEACLQNQRYKVYFFGTHQIGFCFGKDISNFEGMSKINSNPPQHMTKDLKLALYEIDACPDLELNHGDPPALGEIPTPNAAELSGELGRASEKSQESNKSARNIKENCQTSAKSGQKVKKTGVNKKKKSSQTKKSEQNGKKSKKGPCQVGEELPEDEDSMSWALDNGVGQKKEETSSDSSSDDDPVPNVEERLKRWIRKNSRNRMTPEEMQNTLDHFLKTAGRA